MNIFSRRVYLHILYINVYVYIYIYVYISIYTYMYLFKFETHDFWFPIVPVPCHLALHELGLEVHGVQQLLKFSTMGVAF